VVEYQKIGKYEVTEKLGEGGFGIVYKGQDPHLKREVAIKLCTLEDPELRRRFFREAEIAGKLQHRNVVTVFSFGFEGEVPYLVQELLPGKDLRQLIRERTSIPLLDKLDYLLQMASGLAYAHSEGVIHRDVKPANVRVLDNDQLKIMDFGIAKLVSAQTQLTQKGVALGTTSYLAPEQVRGGEIDGRADLFSFGVVAYELLTYQRPFRGNNFSALVYQVLYKEPAPMTSCWAACPPPLAEIVERCLEKEPADRFADFDELIPRLRSVLEEVAAGRWPEAEESVLPAAAAEEGEGESTRPVPEVEGGTEDATVVSPDAPTLRTPPSAPMTPPPSPPAAATQRISVPDTSPPASKPSGPPSAATQRITPPPAPSTPSEPPPAATQRIPVPDTAPKDTAPKPTPPPGAAATQRITPPADAPSADAPSADAAKTQRIEVIPEEERQPPAPGGDEPQLASAAHEISQLVAQGDLEAARRQLERIEQAKGAEPQVPSTAPKPPPPTPPSKPPTPPKPTPPKAQPTAPRPTPPKSQPTPLKPTPPKPQPKPQPKPPKPTPPAPRAEPPAAAPAVEHRPLAGREAPSPAAPRAPRPPLPRWAIPAAAGVVLVLGIGLLVWLLSRGGGDQPVAEEVAETPAPAVEEPGTPAPGPALGGVSVNALPWARLTEITDASGYLQPLPDDPSTPLFLRLPPGEYRLTLEHPDHPEELGGCELEVVAEEVQSCVVEFGEPASAVDYFKDSGWWR